MLRKSNKYIDEFYIIIEIHTYSTYNNVMIIATIKYSNEDMVFIIIIY